MRRRRVVPWSILVLVVGTNGPALRAQESRPVAAARYDAAPLAAPAGGLRQATYLAPNGDQALPPARPAAYTLGQLTRMADASNPILRRDLARVESARGARLQSGLYPNPRFDTNNPEVFAGKDTQLCVGFQQEIVVQGKLRLEQAAATRALQQAEWTWTQDRFDLFTAVRQQFYTVLAAQRRVELLTQLGNIVQRSLETGRKREKAGEANHTDVLLLTIDYQRVQVDLRNAQTLLSGTRRQLAAVVGVPDLVISEAVGNLADKLPDFDEGQLRNFVANEHAQVQISRLDIERNRTLLRRAEVEPYPNVTVGPAYNFGVVPGRDQFWFNVNLPLPTWDRNQGNIRSARADVNDAAASLNVLQNDLLRQASDALSRHRAAREQAEQFERDILPNTHETMRLAQDGYAKGLFDFATYLQAQRTMVETTKDYVGALETAWGTAAELAGLLQLENFP